MIKNFIEHLFFAADTGAGSSGTAPTEETGETGDATGSETTDSGNNDKKFSQSELDAIVKDRVAREKRSHEAAQERARKEAEQKNLEEQGEWKKLAEKHAQRITELEATTTQVETLTTELERYKTTLSTYLESQSKDIPAHIKTLLSKLDVVEQLEWLSNNREALQPEAGTPVLKGGTPRRVEGAKPQAQPATPATPQKSNVRL